MATLNELKALRHGPDLQDLVGATAIVGLWQLRHNEPVVGTQYVGIIRRIDDMLVLGAADDGELAFPVTADAIIPAPRGTYTLRMTDEVVRDPDYLLSWRLDLMEPFEQSQWQANSAPHVYSIVGREWAYEGRRDQDYENQLIATRAGRLLGRTALVGLRRYRVNAGVTEFVSQSQVFGTLQRISPTEGVVLQQRDGMEIALPPQISLIQPAPKLEYTLHETGEVISEPDYLAQWTLMAGWVA